VFLGVFIFVFLYLRTGRFYLTPGYIMPTKHSALAAFVGASIAFYVESSRTR
jgi:hypothetical protein